MMPEDFWKQLAGKWGTVTAGCMENIRLGGLIGCGGAGAVYEFTRWGSVEWVIKVLDPDSPVAGQELKSLRHYRGSTLHYKPGVMKFNSWTGTLECEGRKYFCYMMRRGRTLAEVIRSREKLLDDPQELLRISAFLVNGICALKNAGISHGDIKAENILLMEYKDTFYPVLADYGTVSDSMLAVRTVSGQCEVTEYASELEKRIAYDLHCLCLVLYKICGIAEDGNLPLSMDDRLFKLIRIMRNHAVKAFDRLKEIMDHLEKYLHDIPVSFYLDAVVRRELTEHFPFEKVMQWGEYAVLRDKNASPGEVFDPLLLMKIPCDRYDKVYDILVEYNDINLFVMPIARYFDKDGNEYVLIHAPDDRNKCSRDNRDEDDERIQDDTAIPYTLKHAGDYDKKNEKRNFLRILTDLKVNIEFSTQDIWHMDDRWKMNLFSVDFLEFPEAKTEKLCLIWK